VQLSENVVSQIVANKQRKIGEGQGRNSEVFLCHDPQLGGPIVLKEIPIVNFGSTNEYFKEAQVLYANKHINVAPVLYAGKDDNYVRIAMPYYKNGSLQDKLLLGPVTTRKIIHWSIQFLSGLHHVHVNGFIHFDIKPTNILFNNENTAMLADFGQTMPTNQLGIAKVPPLYPWHIPPEAFEYTHVTKQADIYQVGLTLYRMCNGDRFFCDQKPNINLLQNYIQNGKFPNRNKFMPHVPRRLKTIIRKALNVNPTSRYQTALELIDELGQVNSLLDWQYFQRENKLIWIQMTSQHDHIIEIEFQSPKKYEVKGKIVRQRDGHERKKSDWCRGVFSTLPKAFQSVNEIFRELEG
jgi:eukaryotic-like serine/threonine-protein kinase